MTLISLEEAKAYLRVDSEDEDAMISSLILSAGNLAKDVGRLTDEKWEAVSSEPDEEDSTEVISLRDSLRIAVLYAIGYLYEHRDEADHHGLTLTLRSLLFSVREGII